jgi:hypothetical protein
MLDNFRADEDETRHSAANRFGKEKTRLDLATGEK